MESTSVNWDALDSLVIDFVKSENLLEDSPSSSPPPSPSSSPSSASYQSRLLIRQIRRSIEFGDIESAVDFISRHAPAVLQDHRILFRLHKQKFIELLRRGTEKDRDSAIQCVRVALAPCALDAYPEAYEEFKHVLLALIYDEKDQTSPVANEWAEKQRSELAGLLCSMLRACLHAYDPLFLMTLRYLISIHKVYCFRQGISSPISDLTERLLFDDRDPPATLQESLYEAPPFDEVDIQALTHAVELTRQGAVDSLRFARGDLFQAFQNELCRMRLDVSMLDQLVHEYCVYRGIVDSATKSPTVMKFASSSSRECSSLNLDSGNNRLSDGETSASNVDADYGQEVNANSTRIQINEVEMRCSSEGTNSHEDCSTSDANHHQSCGRIRRSRYPSDGGRRKRWRGRAGQPELAIDSPLGTNKQDFVSLVIDSGGCQLGEEQVSISHSSLENITCLVDNNNELVLEMKEMADKGLVAEVVEEVNAIDPDFFNQNPNLLFQLKQIEFLKLVNGGNVPVALKVACSHLGPLAAKNEALLKPLKETLLALLDPTEAAQTKCAPLSALATSLQVAIGRRLGIKEPQLMKIMRATLHTHSEWFKLQMCKDRFEEFLKIDHLKEVDAHIYTDVVSKILADNCVNGFSQSTISSSSKLQEDGSSPSQGSSTENALDEGAILKVMEFLALPRAEAIHLLMQNNGNAEAAIQQIFS